MCEFVFDPSLWPRETSKLTEPWECPYPPVKGENYCIFHLPRRARNQVFPTISERNSEYRKAIAKTGRIQIICTTVDHLNLKGLWPYIANGSEVKIGFSTVLGTVDFSREEILRSLQIVDCRFGKIDLSHASVQAPFGVEQSLIVDGDFTDTTFHDRVQATDTTFHSVSFMEAVFSKHLTLCDSMVDSASISEVEDNLGEGHCRFIQTANFMGAKFNNGAIFAKSIFRNGANFFHSEFKSGCVFHGTTFSTGVVFDSATFTRETDFTDVEFGTATFSKSVFNGPASFEGSEFGSKYVYLMEEDIPDHIFSEGIERESVQNCNNVLGNGVFSDKIEDTSRVSASFNETESNDIFRFTDINSKYYLTIPNAKFHHIELDVEFENHPCSVAFYGSEINGGVFRFNHKNSLYEVPRTDLGDVTIDSKQGINPFRNLFIDNTSFYNFDFFDNRDHLEDIRWEIDGVRGNEFTQESENKETTYAKAKLGASDVGDSLAESNFFVREKRTRRQKYTSRFADSDDVRKKARYGVQWALNKSYDIACVYGESPGRVVGWSLFCVGIFSVLYGIIEETGIQPVEYTFSVGLGQNETLNITIWGMGNLIASWQSFTGFMFGGGIENATPMVNLLSSIESFIGAFLISLFVATIVRSVDR